MLKCTFWLLSSLFTFLFSLHRIVLALVILFIYLVTYFNATAAILTVNRNEPCECAHIREAVAKQRLNLRELEALWPRHRGP